MRNGDTYHLLKCKQHVLHILGIADTYMTVLIPASCCTICIPQPSTRALRTDGVWSICRDNGFSSAKQSKHSQRSSYSNTKYWCIKCWGVKNRTAVKWIIQWQYWDLDSHVDVGFEHMTSLVSVKYDVMRSYEVQKFVNKPKKGAFKVCRQHVNMTAHSDVHGQVNDYLNLLITDLQHHNTIFQHPIPTLHNCT